MLQLNIESADISDGDHTFADLYGYQSILFINLMATHRSIAWRCKPENGELRIGIDFPNVGTVPILVDDYWSSKLHSDITLVPPEDPKSQYVISTNETLIRLAKVAGESMFWNGDEDPCHG